MPTTRVTAAQLRAAVVRYVKADRRLDDIEALAEQGKADMDLFVSIIERRRNAEHALIRLGTKLLGKGKT